MSSVSVRSAGEAGVVQPGPEQVGRLSLRPVRTPGQHGQRRLQVSGRPGPVHGPLRVARRIAGEVAGPFPDEGGEDFDRGAGGEPSSGEQHQAADRREQDLPGGVDGFGLVPAVQVLGRGGPPGNRTEQQDQQPGRGQHDPMPGRMAHNGVADPSQMSVTAPAGR